MEIKTFQSLTYALQYPDDYRPGQRRPLLLLFHGAGSRGTDISLITEDVFFTATAKHQDFPFIVAAPQCHGETWFDLFETVKAFVLHISSLDCVDPSRVYIMGVSMGAYCTWQLIMSLPEVFAAAVPICGGGMYWNAGRLKDLPIRAFHGALDTVVYPEESEKLVRRVNEEGGCATLTVYPECDHDSWTKTFEDPEVFAWLLTQHK